MKSLNTLPNEILIKSKSKWSLINFNEIWRFRELFYIFVWRDIKVRYKQTLFGILWVLFQPLVTTGIFTIFFGRLAKIPSDNMPYELFALTGLVFWIFFSTSLTQASNSMIENLNLIKKVYFPKEILPIASAITTIIDLSIGFTLVIIAAFYYGYRPSLYIFIVFPIATFIALCTSAGIGMFLASVNVKYRDVRYVLPFFIQTMLFVTPVIYPVASVRDSVRILLTINPMTGVIDSIRKVVAGSSDIDYQLLLISFSVSLVFFLLGLIYFRFTEKFFADIA